MRVVVPLMTTDFLFISHIIWARSLAGKAPRSQRGDREFESLRVHQKIRQVRANEPALFNLLPLIKR